MIGRKKSLEGLIDIPSKEWQTVSLKRKLVKELKTIAEDKDIAHTTLINQILWNYVDKWKGLNL